jgi:hypothetical protein
MGTWYEKLNFRTFPPKVKIEYVAHFHIREVKFFGLSEDLNVLLSHVGQISERFLKLNRGHFFQHLFQFIIHQSIHNTTICTASC